MNSFDDYAKNKKYEIKRQRQILSIRLYFFMFLIGLTGVFPTLLTNPLLSKEEIRTYLITVLALIFSVFAVLYLCYRMEQRIKTVDFILFIINLFIYLTVLFTSPNMKVLNAALWMPIMIMFVFSLKNRLYTLLFVLVHLGTTIYFFITSPTYDFTINPGTYYGMISITVLLMVSTYLLIRLNNNYEDTMLSDYKKLQNSNQELSALNEEYYASQEELMSQYDEIQFLAYHDPLTKQLNRSGFTKTLTTSLDTSHEGCIVLMDIVRFNDLNNVYSYETGDAILGAVSDELVKLPLKQCQVARLGNDIFAVLVQDFTETEKLIELLTSLKNSFDYVDTTIKLSFRIGIVPYFSDETSAEELIKNAEISLSKAKEQDHPTYCIYNETLHEDTDYQIKLFYDLDKALKNKKLHLNFQPIYETGTNNLVSFEALARWTHEAFGFIRPDVFISLAEKSILIHHLGVHIRNLIAEMIGDIQALSGDTNDDYHHLPFRRITLNLSGKELAKKDFSDLLIDQFNKLKIPSHLIGIEITESGFIDNMELAMKHLGRFKEEGYTVYLDDFGTGYSSLNYLDKLPIDVLKIDKTFIDQLPHNKRKQRLLMGIVNLAKSLQIETVAEGVETKEEYDIICEMGVNYVQGYFFSKPLSKEDTLKLIEERSSYV